MKNPLCLIVGWTWHHSRALIISTVQMLLSRYGTASGATPIGCREATGLLVSSEKQSDYGLEVV